jgi:ADP-ribosyl-[dinitrogen reductase] hydrolase
VSEFLFLQKSKNQLILQLIKITTMNFTINHTKSVLFGVAVGDALGVPVEFKSRESLKGEPVTNMRGYGTHNVPTGTWSDDSSLTFCLAEALIQGFNLEVLGQNFVKWYMENYWTAHGSVFDIGITTRKAIERIAQGEKPENSGGFKESENGNGSLMRILPLVFYLSNQPIEIRFEVVKKVSSITHGHIRSVVACFYYLEFANLILQGESIAEAYQKLKKDIVSFLSNSSIDTSEIDVFNRILKGNIYELDEQQIESSGYVLHTLEASIWCLMTSFNYEEAVLKAVNLGSDTDTTAAVTGGLAALVYGYEGIPVRWIEKIARKEDIENLAERLLQANLNNHYF